MIRINDKTEKDYKADFIHWECTVPEPQSERVTVPLRDGFIDLTSMLSDEIKYNSRQITIGLELRSLRGEWPLYWSQMMRDIHGKEVEVSRSDDPNYYYIGVAAVGPIEEHGATAGVTITVEAQPFKRTIHFVDQTSYTLSGDRNITITNKYMRGYPTFECSATGMTAKLNGITWSLPQGEIEPFGMYFSKGDNVLTLHGAGTMQIAWRGGLL